MARFWVGLVGRALEEVRERRDHVCVSFREAVDGVGETYEGSKVCPGTWGLEVLDGGYALGEDHDLVVGNPVAEVFKVVADEVTFGKAAVEFVVLEPRPGEDEDVVQVYGDEVVEQIVKGAVHCCLEVAVFCSKGGFENVIRCDADLVIAGGKVDLGEVLGVSQTIEYFIDVR
ncbi:hypothetical protein HK101_003907 [Irineochytrium annulatum]|nr:hypothetical protein HK101_003907 [Irineochytrium annulatum]